MKRVFCMIFSLKVIVDLAQKKLESAQPAKIVEAILNASKNTGKSRDIKTTGFNFHMNLF
jgi:hypothetical protein